MSIKETKLSSVYDSELEYLKEVCDGDIETVFRNFVDSKTHTVKTYIRIPEGMLNSEVLDIHSRLVYNEYMENKNISGIGDLLYNEEINMLSNTLQSKELQIKRLDIVQRKDYGPISVYPLSCLTVAKEPFEICIIPRWSFSGPGTYNKIGKCLCNTIIRVDEDRYLFLYDSELVRSELDEGKILFLQLVPRDGSPKRNFCYVKKKNNIIYVAEGILTFEPTNTVQKCYIPKRYMIYDKNIGMSVLENNEDFKKIVITINDADGWRLPHELYVMMDKIAKKELDKIRKSKLLGDENTKTFYERLSMLFATDRYEEIIKEVKRIKSFMNFPSEDSAYSIIANHSGQEKYDLLGRLGKDVYGFEEAKIEKLPDGIRILVKTKNVEYECILEETLKAKKCCMTIELLPGYKTKLTPQDPFLFKGIKYGAHIELCDTGICTDKISLEPCSYALQESPALVVKTTDKKVEWCYAIDHIAESGMNENINHVVPPVQVAVEEYNSEKTLVETILYSLSKDLIKNQMEYIPEETLENDSICSL